MLARRRPRASIRLAAVVVPWTRWLPILALVLSQHALASAQRLPPPEAALQRDAAADEAPLRQGQSRGTGPDGVQAQSAVPPAPALTPLPSLLGDDALARDTVRPAAAAAALDGGASAVAPPLYPPPLLLLPPPWNEGANVTKWAPWKPPINSGWPNSSCHCRDNIFALTAHHVGDSCWATPTAPIVQKKWDPWPTWPTWPFQWSPNASAPSPSPPLPAPSPSPRPSAAAIPSTGLRGFSMRSRALNSSCCPETRFEYACAPTNVSSSVQVTLWTDPFKLGSLLDLPESHVSCMAGTVVQDGLPEAGQAATSRYRVPRTGFLQSFVLQASENRKGSDRARWLYNCTFPAGDSGVTADNCVEYVSAGTEIPSDRAGDVSILSGSDSVPGTKATQVVCPAGRLLSSFRLERYKLKGGVIDRVRFRYVCCRGRQDRSRWRARPLSTGDNITELARIYDVAESALVVSNLPLLANHPDRDAKLKVGLGSPDGAFRASSGFPANRTTIRIPWSMSQKDALALGDMAVAILKASETVSLAPGTSMSDFVRLIVATLAPVDIVVADAMHRLAASFIPEASASVVSKATGEVVHRIAAGSPVQTEGTKQVQAAYLLSAVTSALVNVTALATLDVLAAANATFARRLDQAQGAVARQLCATLSTRAARNAEKVLNTTLARNASLLTAAQEDALCPPLVGRRRLAAAPPPPRRHVLAAIGTATLPFAMVGCDGSSDCRLGWQNGDSGAEATRGSPQIHAAADLEAFGRFVPVDPGVIVADGYWNSTTPASLVAFDPRDYDVYFALREQPDRIHPERARFVFAIFALIALITEIVATVIVVATVVEVGVVAGLVIYSVTNSDGKKEITLIDLEALSLFRLQAPVMQHLELAGALPLFPRYRPWAQDQNFYNPWTDPPSPDLRPLPPSPDEYGYPTEGVLPREWVDGGQSDGGGFVDPSTKKPFAPESLTFSPLPTGIVTFTGIVTMMMKPRGDGPNSKKCSQMREDGDKTLDMREGDGLLAGYAGLGDPTTAGDPVASRVCKNVDSRNRGASEYAKAGCFKMDTNRQPADTFLKSWNRASFWNGIGNNGCLRCSCEFAKWKLIKRKDWNLTMSAFLTPNVLCFPDAAYVYEAAPPNLLLHNKRCQLGPGACETPETKKYYVDNDQPWSEINSQERAKWLSMYSGVYGGGCLGVEADEECRPWLYWGMKILEALGADPCLMPLFRYYWLTGHVLVGVDLQVLFVYIRGEYRGMTKAKYEIDDKEFVYPDLAKKCSCMDQSLNETSLPESSAVACSDACRMTEKKIKAYFGLNIFLQIGPWIISPMNLRLVARDSPTGQLAIAIVDESLSLDTCFTPDPNIKCS